MGTFVRLYLLISFVLFCQIIYPQQLNSNKITELINTYEEGTSFSGVVLLTQNDSLIYRKAFGYSNKTFDVENTISTRFNLASISKEIVVAALIKLASEGKINLSSPVSKYIGNELGELGKTITVSQLLCHTSGLPREVEFNHCDNLTLKDFMERIKTLKPLFNSGEKYGYSNAGYIVLGRIIEVVTGVEYSKYIKNEILEPLKMDNTGFTNGEKVIKNLSTGYYLGRNGISIGERSRQLGIYPPGGMYSTADDLVKFVQGLRYNKLFSSAWRDSIFNSHIGIEKNQYSGYGFEILLNGDKSYYLAAGSAEGNKNALLIDAKNWDIIIILSNDGDTPVFDILKDLLKVKSGQTPIGPKVCNINDTTYYKKFIGEYDFSNSPIAAKMDQKNFIISFFFENGHFFLFDPSDNSTNQLCETEQRKLKLSFTNEMSIWFNASKENEYEMLISWDSTVSKGIRVK
jgi:hypothetical protein